MVKLGLLFLGVFFFVLSPALNAQEVASMVACKEDGNQWLCAAYKDSRFQIFQSDRFIAKVEFSGEFSPARAAYSLLDGTQASTTTMASDRLPAAEYTIQLMACDNQACRQRMNKLEAIPDNRTVYINNEGKLWQVLTVGGYSSKDAAQRAADALVSDYGLENQPWVRTVESIQSRIVEL